MRTICTSALSCQWRLEEQLEAVRRRTCDHMVEVQVQVLADVKNNLHGAREMKDSLPAESDLTTPVRSWEPL